MFDLLVNPLLFLIGALIGWWLRGSGPKTYEAGYRQGKKDAQWYENASKQRPLP